MAKPKIELITCESGDWQVLRVKTDTDDEQFSGHSIDPYIFLEVIRDYLGCEIETRCISDEDMEMEKY